LMAWEAEMVWISARAGEGVAEVAAVSRSAAAAVVAASRCRAGDCCCCVDAAAFFSVLLARATIERLRWARLAARRRRRGEADDGLVRPAAAPPALRQALLAWLATPHGREGAPRRPCIASRGLSAGLARVDGRERGVCARVVMGDRDEATDWETPWCWLTRRWMDEWMRD